MDDIVKRYKFILEFSDDGKSLVIDAIRQIVSEDSVYGHDEHFVITYSNPRVDDFEDLIVYLEDFIDELRAHKFKRISFYDGETYEIF